MWEKQVYCAVEFANNCFPSTNWIFWTVYTDFCWLVSRKVSRTGSSNAVSFLCKGLIVMAPRENRQISNDKLFLDHTVELVWEDKIPVRVSKKTKYMTLSNADIPGIQGRSSIVTSHMPLSCLSRTSNDHSFWSIWPSKGRTIHWFWRSGVGNKYPGKCLIPDSLVWYS